MASFARPSVIRQTCNALTLTRNLSTKINFTAAPTSPILRQACAQRPSLAVQGILPKTTRIAAFQTSSRRDILPPPPQRIDGTANDAAPIPTPHPMDGSYHWSFERLVSIGLIPLTIAPFAGTAMHPLMDATLVGLLIIHSHIGFSACVTDYFPHWRVPKTRKAMDWLLRIMTIVAAVGFYEFETNDVGLTEAVKRIWKAGKTPAPAVA